MCLDLDLDNIVECALCAALCYCCCNMCKDTRPAPAPQPVVIQNQPTPGGPIYYPPQQHNYQGPTPQGQPMPYGYPATPSPGQMPYPTAPQGYPPPYSQGPPQPGFYPPQKY